MSPVAENELLFSTNGFQAVSGRPVVELSLVGSVELVGGCASQKPQIAWFFLCKSIHFLPTPWATPIYLSSKPVL